ncbi:MAG: ATP synthase F1 subunit epsilon [Magnetospirillum sp.]|nr:ATP synthase F1 subunit epsilon [Magnetospirillum sp.]
MAEKILFELVSPARLLVSSPVEMVVVPGAEGDFGALPRHTPMITSVRPGVLDVHDGGKVSSRIFVSGGFAEVTEDRVTVLAEEAIPLAELSRETATARLLAAKQALADAKGDVDRAAAEWQFEVATAMDAAAQ